MLKFWAMLYLLIGFVQPVHGFEWIGGMGVFTNDFLGDQKDRWRTMSLSRSEFFGPKWQGQLNTPITEFRLRFEMIAPERIWAAAPYDRPFVGLIGIGAFRHQAWGAFRLHYGAEAVIIGPQTGIENLLHGFHDAFDYKDPIGTSYQLDNVVFPMVEAGISRSFSLQPAVQIIPFASLQAGVENFARIGVDLLIGRGTNDIFFAREPVTGHLIGAMRNGPSKGPILSIGADIAAISGSLLLPDWTGTTPEPLRMRLRAGLDTQFLGWDIFYGATWLGPELSGQNKGQIVGSIAMFLRF